MLLFQKRAIENAPILLQGTVAEKSNLWQIYKQIHKTPTGRQVIQNLEETYKRTGKKLPIKIGPTQEGNVAFYSGPDAGVTLGERYQNYSDADVCLAHELTHHVQRLRPLCDVNVQFESIHDAFVTKKMIELEAYIQDTIIRDEKDAYPDTCECLFIDYYTLHKQAAKMIYGKDSALAKRYAKTELTRLLWLGAKAASYDKGKSFLPADDILYEVVEEWNKLVNDQTKPYFFQKANIRPKADSANQATSLMKQFLTQMQVDLTPEFFKNNLNLSSATDLIVFKELIKADNNTAFLRPNSGGGFTFHRVLDGTTIAQKAYNTDGELIYARVKKFTPTERISMLINYTKDKVEQKVHSYYPDGKLVAVQNYKDGHLEGELRHCMGSVNVNAWFKAGKPSGEVSCCDGAGDLISKGVYENGNLTKVIKNKQHLEHIVNVLLTIGQSR